jgi:3-dehydroquinate synthase
LRRLRRASLKLEDVLQVDLVVGRGARSAVADLAKDYDKLLIVADKVIASEAAAIAGKLEGRVQLKLVEGGESFKSVESVLSLWSWMVEAEATRRSLVVALGGGSVLDTAGFAAATYMRGIDWAAVPTTALSMLDAAVGGKTGVNYMAKNIVGAFHHPRYVIVDVEFALGLPISEYRQGLSELVKHALLAGGEMYQWLKANVGRLAARNLDAIEEAVYRSLTFKLSIVARDYRDRAGTRILLNLGHTVAHALEAASGYSVGHGAAVAAGLLAELIISSRLLGMPEERVDEVRLLLQRLGALANPPQVAPEEMARFIAMDKKRKGGTVLMVLLEDVGKPRVVDLPLREAENLVEQVWRMITQWI